MSYVRTVCTLKNKNKKAIFIAYVLVSTSLLYIYSTD